MLALKDFRSSSIEEMAVSIKGGYDVFAHTIETDTGVFTETWVTYDDGSVYHTILDDNGKGAEHNGER